ncbi:hypothetical protein [Dactylosporangium sp. NPDC005555]|uniref:helix-turn-helix domain-containing protein n=1 Tax=Dactylosporangium sp. NPDC005555 TaxID=3154889 RepID=UPI00339E93D4
MIAVREWSGSEALALRKAMRMSVREFALHLGVAARTVSKWEQLGPTTSPRPQTQAILDTALARCPATVQLRFELHTGTARPQPPASTPDLPRSGSGVDHESWTDDLERAVAALSRQSFTIAGTLLERWLHRADPHRLDDTGRYLYARTATIHGDLRRDQGIIMGPHSADRSYQQARALFGQLGNDRRLAQLDLALAVLTEMAGDLAAAATRYETLAVDDRLSRRDRARARLWIGTALTKHGDTGYATIVMTAAARDFEHLDEAEDWAVAQQKLALAHRGAGRIGDALRSIGLARTAGGADAPMQQVRLDTAHGHILLTDPATADEGLTLLTRCARLADRYGMHHQRRSIDSIRHTFERTNGRAHT